MKAIEIRNKYLDFFKRHGHAVIPSASLIPDATKFGLDFTLCALFIALILPKLINIPQVLAFITGGVTALCFLLIDMKYEGIIIGALIGAFAGYFMNMRLHHGK